MSAPQMGAFFGCSYFSGLGRRAFFCCVCSLLNTPTVPNSLNRTAHTTRRQKGNNINNQKVRFYSTLIPPDPVWRLCLTMRCVSCIVLMHAKQERLPRKPSTPRQSRRWSGGSASSALKARALY